MDIEADFVYLTEYLELSWDGCELFYHHVLSDPTFPNRPNSLERAVIHWIWVHGLYDHLEAVASYFPSREYV